MIMLHNLGHWFWIVLDVVGFESDDRYAFMKHSQHTRPLLFGVFFSALAPTLLLSALLMISPERVMIPVLLVVLVAFPVSLAASVLFALPYAMWLRSKGWLSAIPLCVAGLVIGAIVMATFNYQMNYWPQMNDQSLAGWIAWNSAQKGAASGAALGAISAAAFCMGAGIKIRSNRTMPVERP